MSNRKKIMQRTGIGLALVLIGLCLYIAYNFPPRFDDKVVTVSLIKQELASDGMNYTLQVTNNGSYTLKDNSLFFTPRKNMQSFEPKPIQGDTRIIRPGETLVFTVSVPKDLFTDLQSSQIISSEVMLKGYVNWWFWKVPFTKSGSIDINHPTLA